MEREPLRSPHNRSQRWPVWVSTSRGQCWFEFEFTTLHSYFLRKTNLQHYAFIFHNQALGLGLYIVYNSTAGICPRRAFHFPLRGTIKSEESPRTKICNGHFIYLWFSLWKNLTAGNCHDPYYGCQPHIRKHPSILASLLAGLAFQLLTQEDTITIMCWCLSDHKQQTERLKYCFLLCLSIPWPGEESQQCGILHFRQTRVVALLFLCWLIHFDWWG